ncbi:MAG: Flp family type IVb pilin [Candidatus Methanomethylophilus sp.]|nr:Flp family type IVb pilin [Methanomethylophilus sp.]
MVKNFVEKFIKEESGQGMTEYAILVALLVIALIVVVGGLSKGMGSRFTEITKDFKDAPKKGY